MNEVYLGNDLRTWLISFSIILGSFVLGKTIYWFCKNFLKVWLEKRGAKLGHILVDMAEEPLILSIFLTGVYWGVDSLSLNVTVAKITSSVFFILTLCNVAWFVTRFFDALSEAYFVPFVKNTRNSLDEQLLSISSKTFKFTTWALAIIVGVDNAGYEIKTILAGLGIGGMALALAAKDTISNLFGGVTIFIDKPFKLRERVIVKGHDGFVEEIGFRTTRIRTLEGKYIYIPNKTVADDVVVNISRERSRRIEDCLRLSFDQPASKLEQAKKIIFHVLSNHPQTFDSPIVSFDKIGEYSLEIFIAYKIMKTANMIETVAQVKNEIYSEVYKRFEEEDIKFAFSNQRQLLGREEIRLKKSA